MRRLPRLSNGQVDRLAVAELAYLALVVAIVVAALVIGIANVL